MERQSRFIIPFAAVGLALFAAGATVGYVMRPVPAPAPIPAAPQPAAPSDDGVALASAKARMAELESELAAAREAAAAAIAKASDAAAAVARADDPAPAPDILDLADPSALDESLRSRMTGEDYGVVSNVFAHMRARRESRDGGRIGYLESVDTSSMGEKDLATHRRYIELLVRQRELAAKATGLIPDMATLTKQVELQMEINPLAKAERAILLGQMTDELGYSGEDAAAIHDTIGDIYEATSSGGGIGGIIGNVVEEVGADRIIAPPPAAE